MLLAGGVAQAVTGLPQASGITSFVLRSYITLTIKESRIFCCILVTPFIGGSSAWFKNIKSRPAQYLIYAAPRIFTPAKYLATIFQWALAIVLQTP
ncbi:hypothetical protein EVAR_26721_1 [Eumeta japonica]|uniref:Uncharacterized protein n=1 Tax=Eumeta variegata TaxID=151549 RepID=A0A4C1XD70_EUMVA|nr:hypothetical protein EVAR_26721_1 [Eumeta japonica]